MGKKVFFSYVEAVAFAKATAKKIFMSVLLKREDAKWVVSSDKEFPTEGETAKKCNGCGTVIPLKRLELVPNTTYCVQCLENFETNNPIAVERKVDEGIGGTRDEYYRNRKRYDGS